MDSKGDKLIAVFDPVTESLKKLKENDPESLEEEDKNERRDT